MPGGRLGATVVYLAREMDLRLIGQGAVGAKSTIEYIYFFQII